MKNGLTLLNLLILLSLIITPIIMVVTANNIIGIANSLQIAEPTTSFKDRQVTISSLLTVRNPGPFDIEAGVVASIKGDKGTDVEITAPSILVKAAPTQQKIPLLFQIDLSKFTEEDMARLAANPDNLTIEISANAGIQPITSVSVEANVQLSWLPPIQNLTFEQPTILDVNKNQVTLGIPFSFDNQSPFFAFDADGVISVFDSSSQQVGRGNIQISSQPQTKWKDSAKIVTSLPANTEDLLLMNSTFKYSVEEAITLKEPPVTTKLEQNITVDWGAPMGNRQFTLSYSPVNATHTRIIANLTFHNNNRFITATGSITPKLVTDSGTTLVGKTQSINTAPGENASLNFDEVIPTNLLINGNPKLFLSIDTQIGSLDMEVKPIG